MLFGIACNSDKLSVQSRNKRKILSFGVADDYVINCCKKAVEYFTLYAETLACTGVPRISPFGFLSLDLLARIIFPDSVLIP